jgi:MoaA/NifB/PqqE/SkfB family radical SAM enzyme
LRAELYHPVRPARGGGTPKEQYIKPKFTITRRLLKKIPYLLKTYVSPQIFRDTAELLLVSNKKITGVFPVEVHVTEHCNLNCKGCSHFSCLAEEEYLDPADFESDCKKLSGITGKLFVFKLLGGEPLLHPRITELNTIARKYFPKTPIQISTNGLLLTTKPEEFWINCHDNNIGILISQYPIKLDKEKIKKLGKKYKVRIQYVGSTNRDRMMKMPLDLSGGQNTAQSYKNCIMSWGMCVTLREGKIFSCAVAAHIKLFNKYFNQNLAVTDADFVSLDKINSKKELLEYLCKPIPFCRYCRTKENTFGEIWDVSKKEITEWV